MLGKVIEEKKSLRESMRHDRDTMIHGMGEDMVNLLIPLMKEIAQISKINKIDLMEIMKNVKVDAKIMTPDVKIPEIKIPETKVNVTTPNIDISGIVRAIKEIQIKNDIRVPEMRVPDINVPEIRMPEEMTVRGWVGLQGVNLENPLPVQIRDANGKPINFTGNGSTIIQGSSGGGGKHDFFTIKDIKGSTASLIDQTEGALKVTGSLSASLSADTGEGEIGAETLRIVQATDAISSVHVASQFGTTYTTDDLINSDNRLRVSLETGGSGLTDAELRASRVPVGQVSGANWSVKVTGFGATVGATMLDGEGNYRDTMPIEGTVAVSGITNSVAAALIDSSGVQYSSSNPLPIDDAGGSITVDGPLTDTQLRTAHVPVGQVSGANWSVSVTSIVASTTAIIGDKAADEADGDSNPVKVGGVARTANPTAVGNGDRVSASYDDVGRVLNRPVQVRDLMQTAYVEAASEGEKVLLVGVASTFHDLVYVMGANSSDAAITIDIRQSTGGTVQMTLEIPANGTAGVSIPVPIPQDHADASWTVDNNSADASNTTYQITGLFSKEV